MRRLVQLKAVERKPLYAKGNPAQYWMYKLGPVGQTFIRETYGIDPPRFDMGASAYLPSVWWHTKATNDFFITANLWAKQQQAKHFPVTIEQFRTELDLKRDKKHFPANGVIPDGWIDIMDRGRKERFCFLLEVETGSQYPAVIREKVQKLIAFVDGTYEAIFGTPTVVQLWIAGEGADHRMLLVKTIAQTLREVGVASDDHIHYVTSVQPDHVALFTQPVWHTAGADSGSDMPHGLFD
jgi:hypothetical protein